MDNCWSLWRGKRRIHDFPVLLELAESQSGLSCPGKRCHHCKGHRIVTPDQVHQQPFPPMPTVTPLSSLTTWHGLDSEVRLQLPDTQTAGNTDAQERPDMDGHRRKSWLITPSREEGDI